MAATFDGVDDVYQLAGETTLRYEYTQPFSGAAWIKKASASGGSIFGKAQNSPPAAVQRGWAFNTEVISGSIGISFHLVNNNGTVHAFLQALNIVGFGTTGMQTGLWVPVGFSYDGSGLTSGMTLYANGHPMIPDFADDTLAGNTILVNGTPVRMGGFDTEFWAGSSCGIVIVPAKLSPAEMAGLADIRNLYRNPSSYLSTAPDVWIPLPSPGGTVDLTDRSGNGHDASVSTGAPTSLASPTVVFDTFNQGDITTTGSVSVVPNGHVEAVVVLIQQTGSSLDRISGVTYGGASMTRPTNGFAQDTVGETGASYAYVLTGALPQGGQSATITVSAGSETKRVTVLTINSLAGPRVAADGKVQADVDDPSVVLSTVANYVGLLLNGMYSGLDDRSNITGQSGSVMCGPGSNFGTTCAVQQVGNYDGASLSSGWTTTASDDVAMVALALEVAPAVLAWTKA